MMILRSSAATPFGRKVAMAIDVLGLGTQVRMEPADTGSATDSLRQQNPLGKIPALVLDNGEVLYDSRVIIEYLDQLDGGHRLLPQNGWARIAVQRQQALADGLLDAAILQMYEKRFRPPEHHVQAWLDHQAGKVDRALRYAEATLAHPLSGATPHIGEIAQAAALGYLDFRFGGAWRQTCPQLAAWHDSFARQVPAYARTAPAAA